MSLLVNTCIAHQIILEHLRTLCSVVPLLSLLVMNEWTDTWVLPFPLSTGRVPIHCPISAVSIRLCTSRFIENENGSTHLSIYPEVSRRSNTRMISKINDEKIRCSRTVILWGIRVFTKTDESGKLRSPI